MLNSVIVASRYSKAIFDVAKEKNCVELFSEELKKVSEFLTNDKKKILFFEVPFISMREKREVINNTFKGYREEIKKFIEILVKYGKLRYISDICGAYDELVHKSENKISGKLTVVKKISNEKVIEIEKKISKILNANVVLKQFEEKEVLGGFKVEVGSYVVDSTIKAQLDEFRNSSV